MTKFIDAYQRTIQYLRISVTDKCNLRCRYCMPESGVILKAHSEILSLEKIAEVAEYAISQGVTKIRLTGGEPLLRKNIEYLVERIHRTAPHVNLAMTTNGWYLPRYAQLLKDKGLGRVNIHLDSLDPQRYHTITRGGDLARALEGLRAAQAAGLFPIKLNVVLMNGVNDDEMDTFAAFGRREQVEVRFIPEMNLLEGRRFGLIGESTVGQCALCNRLRLTADGYLKPCLFSAYQVSIRELGIPQAFRTALQNKPECGSYNESQYMYQIGG